MKTRKLGPEGLEVSECGLGCWQLGGGWGNPWDDAVAQEILGAACASGIRFLDTADGYRGGESERSLGRFLRTHPEIAIATKLGRVGMYPDGYTREAMRRATLNSLARPGTDRLDLTQLHCVPTEVLRRGHVFDWLREQREEGLIARFGASVETVEEGLICLEQEGLTDTASSGAAGKEETPRVSETPWGLIWENACSLARRQCMVQWAAQPYLRSVR